MNKKIQAIALKYQEELRSKLQTEPSHPYNEDGIYYMLCKLEIADKLIQKYWPTFNDEDLLIYRDFYKE